MTGQLKPRAALFSTLRLMAAAVGAAALLTPALPPSPLRWAVWAGWAALCALSTAWHLQRTPVHHLFGGVKRSGQVIWTALCCAAAVLVVVRVGYGNVHTTGTTAAVLFCALLWSALRQLPLCLSFWLLLRGVSARSKRA